MENTLSEFLLKAKESDIIEFLDVRKGLYAQQDRVSEEQARADTIKEKCRDIVKRYVPLHENKSTEQ